MAFDAGAVKGRVLLDDSQYKKASNEVVKTSKLMGVSIAAVGAAIVAGFVASIKKANEFTKAFANVRTLVDESKVDMQAMKEELFGLDARLGSATSLTEGLYQALSASVEPAKAVQFVGEAAKFAQAALTDTNTAVDAITTALNAYRLEAEETTRISDIFFTVVKRGKVTGDELAKSIGNVIPTAATLGVNLEELGAAIATMTKQGINANIATTQLTQLMQAFIKPSEEMTIAIEEFGFASGSALIDAQGLEGALEFLQEATGGNIEKMAELIPNVRGLKGALALTGQAAQIFEEDLIAMEKASGATNEAFEKQELTFDTLNNAVEKLQIQIGEALLPVVFELTKGLTKLTEKADFMPSVMMTILQVFKDIFDAFKTGITEAFQPLVDLISEMTEQFGFAFSGLNLFLPILKTLILNIEIAFKVIKFLVGGFVDLVRIIVEASKVIGLFFSAVFNPKKWVEVGQQIGKVGKAVENFVLGFVADSSDMIQSTIVGIGGILKSAVVLTEKNAGEYASIWEKTNKKIVDNTQKTVDDITEIWEDGTKETAIVFGDAGGEIENNFFDKMKEKNAEMKKKWDETGSGILSTVQFVTGQIATAYRSVFSLIMNGLTTQLEATKAEHVAELEDLEATKLARLASLQDELDQGLISEEEFQEREKQINEEALQIKNAARDKQLEKENTEEKKIFKANKANKIAETWIQFAIGTMGAWSQSIAQLGPIAGSIMATILTTLLLGVAIAQTVAISQEQFVPKKQRGGFATGANIINEQGGELVVLPDRSIVVPHDLSTQIARGTGKANGNMIMNVNFRGANITDDMSLRKVSRVVSRNISKTLRSKR
jgi:TP901 family phage tail tape measure protein